MAAMRRMKAFATFDEYLEDQSPRNQAIIRRLRTFVTRVAPGLRETVKWGNGCWVNGKAPVAYVLLRDRLRAVRLLRRVGPEGPERAP